MRVSAAFHYYCTADRFIITTKVAVQWFPKATTLYLLAGKTIYDQMAKIYRKVIKRLL